MTTLKYSRSADALKTEAELTSKLIALAPFLTGYSNPTVDFFRPVDVREGDEDCGSGDLRISGLIRVTAIGRADTHFALDSTGSQWRNYGAPHGTKYDIVLALNKLGFTAR